MQSRVSLVALQLNAATLFSTVTSRLVLSFVGQIAWVRLVHLTLDVVA